MINDDSQHVCNTCGQQIDPEETAEDLRGLNFGLCAGCKQSFRLHHSVVPEKRLPRIRVEPLAVDRSPTEPATDAGASDDCDRVDWAVIASKLSGILREGPVRAAAAHYGGNLALNDFDEANALAAIVDEHDPQELTAVDHMQRAVWGVHACAFGYAKGFLVACEEILDRFEPTTNMRTHAELTAALWDLMSEFDSGIQDLSEDAD